MESRWKEGDSVRVKSHGTEGVVSDVSKEANGYLYTVDFDEPLMTDAGPVDHGLYGEDDLEDC